MIYSELVCVIMCKTQVGHKSSENPYFSRVQTIKEILYAERLSQMENVTNQLFAGLEDVVANQWERVDSQCSRLQNNGIKTGNDLIEFMTEQERVDGLGEKSQNIIAVDSIGRYYYKSGLKGNLKEMDYLDNGYDRINFVTNTMTTNLTEMVFLKKLRNPIDINSNGRKISIIYYGVTRDMKEFNPYFECSAYGGNNTVYVLNGDGIKLFNSRSKELIHGYNTYSVLKKMDYLHGSSFEEAKENMQKDGVSYSNAVLDGTEYYYSMYRMKSAEWTLLFLVPSSCVAQNTVRLVDITVRIVLIFAVSLLIICSVVLVAILRNKQKAVLDAERRNNSKLAGINAELSKAVYAAETAFKTAQSASRAKGEFLANMSHDIRTSMNAVIGMTELIEREADSPEKVREYIGNVRKSSRNLLTLVNEILDMSKIESGKIEMNIAEFNIAELIDRIDNDFRPQAEAKKQDFAVIMHRINHQWLYGDEMRIMQILNNLLSNALKYTPDGGKIRLEISEDRITPGNYAHISFIVTDNGIGMSAEFLERIYEVFSREERTTVNAVEGTGLGMSIVKNLVDLMGGNISVDSIQGKGSSFEVALDLKISQKSEQSITDTDENICIDMRLDGIKFLCAEDNTMNADLLKEFINITGGNCVMCGNGRIAYEKFIHSKPGEFDIILMDVQMPEMNGYEASMAIRQSSHPMAKTIPIIAMTANAFSEDVRNSIAAGMNAHISKPMDLQILIKTVHDMLH